MTIRPFLSDPEMIEIMSEAFRGVCDMLSLELADSPETRLVAKKIVEFAQRGVSDAATLRAMTLRDLKE
jgi:hypothetical protein